MYNKFLEPYLDLQIDEENKKRKPSQLEDLRKLKRNHSAQVRQWDQLKSSVELTEMDIDELDRIKRQLQELTKEWAYFSEIFNRFSSSRQRSMNIERRIFGEGWRVLGDDDVKCTIQ